MMNYMTSPTTSGYTGTYVFITALCPPRQNNRSPIQE